MNPVRVVLAGGRDLEQRRERPAARLYPGGNEHLPPVGELHDIPRLDVRRRVLEEPEVVA